MSEPLTCPLCGRTQEEHDLLEQGVCPGPLEGWEQRRRAGLSLVEQLLERNHGVRLAALFDLAAGLMRGNPAEFKVGYSAAAGLRAAAEQLDLTAEERTEALEAFAYAVTGEPLKLGDKRRILIESGVYVVLVGPDVSDDPVRWCFVDEGDADAFADASGERAWVSFEPVARSLDDPDLAEAFPELVEAARARAAEA